MKNTDSNTWRPSDSDIESSQIARLMAKLGARSYDKLLAISTQEPARYWDVVMKYCGIVWDSAPHAYVDVSAGPEFPRWFPGGRLNWVNTVLQWAHREETAGRAAVIGEREDGTV